MNKTKWAWHANRLKYASIANIHILKCTWLNKGVSRNIFYLDLVSDDTMMHVIILQLPRAYETEGLLLFTKRDFSSREGEPILALIKRRRVPLER